MFLSVIAFLVAFLLLRKIGSHIGFTGYRASIAAAAVCISFVCGSLARPLSLPGSTAETSLPLAVAPLTAPQAAPAPAYRNAPPASVHLTAQQLARLIPLSEITDGTVDTVDFTPDGSKAIVTGWVVDPSTKAPAHAIVLIVDGRARYDVTDFYGQDRPDVARALSTAGAERSGFSKAVIPLASLAKGKHEIAAGAVSQNGRYLVSTVPHSFTISRK